MAPRERWKKAGLFLPYFGKTWVGDEDALRAVEKWAKDLRSHIYQDGIGLLLMGEPGRGKTLLAHIAADRVLDQAAELLPQISRRDVLLALTVQGYLDLFRRRMDYGELGRRGDPEAAEEYLKADRGIRAIQTKVKVVLIDDIGKEHTTATGYAQNEIERMIRARGNRGLPTLITTNLTADEMRNRYSDSFVSYLLQVCIPVPVGGEDYRRGIHGSTR